MKAFTADRIHSWLTAGIQFTLAVAIFGSAYAANWGTLFMSALTLVLTFAPRFFEDRYDIRLPVEFEMVVVLFIYASLFLGEVQGYYARFWWWDAALHVGSGVALGFVGFAILFILDRTSKVQASPSTLAFFAFCFAVAFGAVWEIYEFAMDQLFGFSMQTNGLVDTMWDLIVDSVGALFASVAGYFYLKNGKSMGLSRVMARFVEQNPRLFGKK